MPVNVKSESNRLLYDSIKGEVLYYLSFRMLYSLWKHASSYGHLYGRPMRIERAGFRKDFWSWLNNRRRIRIRPEFASYQNQRNILSMDELQIQIRLHLHSVTVSWWWWSIIVISLIGWHIGYENWILDTGFWSKQSSCLLGLCCLTTLNQNLNTAHTNSTGKKRPRLHSRKVQEK